MNYSLFILPRAPKELAQLNAGAFAHVRYFLRIPQNTLTMGAIVLTRLSQVGVFPGEIRRWHGDNPCNFNVRFSNGLVV